MKFHLLILLIKGIDYSITLNSNFLTFCNRKFIHRVVQVIRVPLKPVPDRILIIYCTILLQENYGKN